MLLEQIQKDIVTAMKAGDKNKVLLLKTIKGEVERSVDKDTSNEAVLRVIKKTKQGLLETDPTSSEIVILDTYLPIVLSEEEMANIIKEVVGMNPEKTLKDMGYFMTIFREITKGAGDMKYMSTKLKEVLT